MLVGVIIACEVMFWVFLALGLTARYLLRRQRLSAVLLVAAPLVDLVLLTASALDLRAGGTATMAHSLAAVYLGVSVGFGHSMVRWADVRFAHRFAGGPAPVRIPKRGPLKAAHERRSWLRHLVAWATGVALIGVAVLLVGDAERTASLIDTAKLWTAILVLDGVVSLSYGFGPAAGRAERDVQPPPSA